MHQTQEGGHWLELSDPRAWTGIVSPVGIVPDTELVERQLAACESQPRFGEKRPWLDGEGRVTWRRPEGAA